MDWTDETYRIYGLSPADTTPGSMQLLENNAACYEPKDRAAIQDAFKRCVSQGEPFDIEATYRSPTKTMIWVRTTGEAIRRRGKIVKAIGTVMDITERKLALNELEQHRNHLEKLVASRTTELALRLAEMTALNDKFEQAQNQLLQADKMSSLGQLAAGVAHEINNPIGYVYSNLFALDNYVKDLFEIISACESAANGTSDPECFARINALKTKKEFDYIKSDTVALISESKMGLNRVKKIVTDLKDFCRVGETSWGWADLHQCINSTLNIAGNELKYKCTINKHFAEDLPQIRCVASQINQILMNLLVNAAHSIETKGEISITTRNLAPNAIQIEIADTGSGIAPDNLRRIFDPFFTTKPVGKGTGLGLSIAYGIVNKHHGNITVNSVLGQGTTFTLWLPIDPEQFTDGAPINTAESIESPAHLPGASVTA